MQIAIVYGFLGCGKTTLINYLLSHTLDGGQVVVLENESGKESVDGDLLRGEGFRVVDLRSGCVCCTLREKMSEAIEEIERTISPALLLIEPSGIASLEDVLTIQGVRIDIILTLVDATRYQLLMRMNGSYFERQFHLSPVILITKSDMVPQSTVDYMRVELSEKNPRSLVLSNREELTTELWSELVKNHFPIFRSYIFGQKIKSSQFDIEDFYTDTPQTETSIRLLFAELETHSGRLIRAKGFMNITCRGQVYTAKIDYTTSQLSFSPMADDHHVGRCGLTFWWLDNRPTQSLQVIKNYIKL